MLSHCALVLGVLYIMSNQPVLPNGRPPLPSQAKGNPMKAHARHVPSSIRNRRTALSQSATPVGHFSGRPEKSVQNPYKSDHFREYEFLSYLPSTTYNFNALSVRIFPIAER